MALAETKEYSSDAPSRTIPKLPKTANDPNLIDGNVYPFWGPVLLESAFDQNEIGLIDTQTKEKILSYSTKDEWVEQVAISDDGSFLAATTGCPDRRAYIFSKDSNEPLFRSEMLTYDSPVQKTRITDDGTLAAFTTDGGPESSLLLLLDTKTKQFLWKYDDGVRRAARSLGMTPDGSFIVVGNMKGDLYLFSKENNTPLKKWQFSSSFGALDVSADGKYVVAGTGASPYFFEDILGPDTNKIYGCETIIEPKPREQAQNKGIINDTQQFLVF